MCGGRHTRRTNDKINARSYSSTSYVLTLAADVVAETCTEAADLALLLDVVWIEIVVAPRLPKLRRGVGSGLMWRFGEFGGCGGSGLFDASTR